MFRRGFVVAIIQLLCHLPASAQLFDDSPLTYPTHAQPLKVRAAELDGLPGIDLITANGAGGSLSLLVNGGFGVYLPPVYVGVEGSADVKDVAAADLDGDLDVDLVAVTLPEVVFLRNDGGLEFTETGSQAAGGGSIVRVETADLDGDHDQDVIFCAEGLQGGVRVMLNAGDGTFASPATIFGPAYCKDVVVTDLNNDTIPDIAAAVSGSVAVMLGLGYGAFADPALYAYGHGLVTISAGLIDDDAFVDLVTLAMSSSMYSLDNVFWTNNGDGTFGDPDIPIYSIYLGAKTIVADFDQQGCQDVATATSDDRGYVHYWLNDCDNWSDEGFVTWSPPPHREIAAADVDSDTDLDVVMTIEGFDVVAVYENTLIESPGIFGDRFETGDTSMWSSTVP